MVSVVLETADMETNFQPCWLNFAISFGTFSVHVVSVLYSQAVAPQCDVPQPDASMAALHRTIINIVFISVT
jgi:hypothetical protein